jgi:hypothetical protein
MIQDDGWYQVVVDGKALAPLTGRWSKALIAYYKTLDPPKSGTLRRCDAPERPDYTPATSSRRQAVQAAVTRIKARR